MRVFQLPFFLLALWLSVLEGVSGGFQNKPVFLTKIKIKIDQKLKKKTKKKKKNLQHTNKQQQKPG